MACKALFYLQKYDDSHIWVFISLWERASRNGLIRISAFMLLHLPSLYQKWTYSYFRLCATPFTIVGTKSDIAVSSQEKDEIMTFTALRDRAKITSVRLTEPESTPDREGISVHSLILGATQRTWLFW